MLLWVGGKKRGEKCICTIYLRGLHDRYRHRFRCLSWIRVVVVAFADVPRLAVGEIQVAVRRERNFAVVTQQRTSPDAGDAPRFVTGYRAIGFHDFLHLKLDIFTVYNAGLRQTAGQRFETCTKMSVSSPLVSDICSGTINPYAR